MVFFYRQRWDFLHPAICLAQSLGIGHRARERRLRHDPDKPFTAELGGS